ncbi:MAG: hypothetical protein MJ192_04500 [Clostridia bacterium]|nr:hypothetical protein [Clostridia bacterium]
MKKSRLFTLILMVSTAALCIVCPVLLCGCGGDDTPADTTGTSPNDPVPTDPLSDTEVPTETPTEPGTDAPLDVAGPETRNFPTEVTITEKGGSASVTTADGLSYTASGYESVTDGRFTFREGFTATFERGYFSEAFTRMRFTYVSTQPLRLFVTYVQDGQEKTDDFYAESGTRLFCCLISDFMKDKTASEIISVRFDSCSGQPCEFALCGLDTQLTTVDIDGQKIYYIDGGRYRLGLSSKWGWTICYLSDTHCDITKVTNLVNMHDSGRLIQQSYYGTRTAQGDFVPGKVNSDVWPYNPVQAGDQANHGSRLIDLVVGDRSVYVKVQPMDWGQTNWFCPAYMENTYIVGDDTVRVDNRYVEFSNYENPYASQELPAFYTVGYFNEFFWYDGDAGWTDGPLSSETDLEMIWTPTEHTGTFDCPVKIGNTETWGALYSRKDGYGIGMFVPNTDQLSAMTYEAADPSKNPKGEPCAYMKAVREIKLVSYVPLEYSYLITCGSIDEIRSVFKTNRNFTDNAGLDVNSVNRRIPGSSMDPRDIDGSVPENAAFFSQGSAGSIASFDEAEQAVCLTALNVDPYVHLVFTSLDEPVMAEYYKGIEITYRIPETDSSCAGGGFQIFLVCGDDREAQGGKQVDGSYVTDGEWHTIFVDFSSKPFWRGQINKLRYDFFNRQEEGDCIFIRSVRLVPAD